jgi:phosphoribosylanthranilate isomerase
VTGTPRTGASTLAHGPCAPRVKICCISSVHEAARAVAHGASALGFVSQMPSGPGVVDEAHIADIIATVPPPIATFLLTSATDSASIIAQHQRMRPTTLQLVDHLDADVHRALHDALPGITLVQVVHVEDQESVDYALSVAATVDALLLDSGRRNAPVRELGGTGRTHDWSLSRRIRDQTNTPIFLAGGLRADNVADAIRTVKPFGLDLCTGVRTNGALDEAKIAQFMRSVLGA